MAGKISAYGKSISEIISDYRKQDFVNDQIQEIRLGLEHGLDVTIYADREYFAVQMRQIRFGLEEGLDVSLYNSKQFDWFQMEEIRLGLKDGIDAAVYADPKYPYMVMRELRRALEDNIHLEKYAAVGADMLHELHRAILDKQNIMPYIKQGYVPEQLSEIRRAMRQGCNIDPYLNKLYRDVSIREITEGLKRGLDVSVYANPEYSWQQMREIRLGLEDRVDVSVYAKELYSWQQMREIRIGLEKRLDVEQYKSMMYSASDMKKIRLRLEQEQKKYVNFIKDSHNDEIPRDIEEFCRKMYGKLYRILVDTDKMKAYAYVGNEAQAPSQEVLREALKKANVVMGIDDVIVEALSQGNIRDELVVIARGKAPAMGKNGFYEEFIKNTKDMGIRFAKDGSAELDASYMFTKVKEGQKLLVYHNAEKGENGFTVTGTTLEAIAGYELESITGRGFKLLGDKRTYIAEQDGCAKYDGSELLISQLLEIEEDASVMDDITFDGSVHILGDVSGRRVIKAKGDIVVEGFVESARLECEGCMLLKKGANSATAKLIAAKDIIGRFFENISLRAANIYANYFFKCNLYAVRSINTYGKNGSISGGSIFAGMVIESANIGNKNGIMTQITMGYDNKGEDIAAAEELKEVESQLVILNNAVEQYKKNYPPEVRNSMMVFLKIENAVYTKETQKKKILERIDRINKDKLECKQAYLKVVGRLYEGTTVAINNLTYSCGDMMGVMLKNDTGHIKISHV